MAHFRLALRGMLLHTRSFYNLSVYCYIIFYILLTISNYCIWYDIRSWVIMDWDSCWNKYYIVLYIRYYVVHIAYYLILVWHFIGSHLLRCHDISCDFATWQLIRYSMVLCSIWYQNIWHRIRYYCSYGTSLVIIYWYIVACRTLS